MYALLVPTVVVSAYGFYRRMCRWRIGQPTDRFDQPWRRIGLLIQNALFQQRTLRERYAGVMHG